MTIGKIHIDPVGVPGVDQCGGTSGTAVGYGVELIPVLSVKCVDIVIVRGWIRNTLEDQTAPGRIDGKYSCKEEKFFECYHTTMVALGAGFLYEKSDGNFN